MREILTTWTGPQGGGTTVMYFTEDVALEDERASLGVFWNAVDAVINSAYAWRIADEGNVIDETTGVVTGFWTGGFGHSGTGASAAQLLPDISQALVRWRTDTVINGRRVQGRTYIPGLTTTATASGNLQAGVLTTIQTAADALATPLTGLGVWHRPQGGAGGDLVGVTGASVWNEFAIQRRRRG